MQSLVFLTYFFFQKLSKKNLGKTVSKTISKLVTNHECHRLVKNDFPNTDITVESSVYASLYGLHLTIVTMFPGCGGEPELTKRRCLLDTTNANVNNMLDEKSTRITKFEECGFSVNYKKKLIQSKDKEHVQLRFGVQKSSVIFLRIVVQTGANSGSLTE